MFLEDVKSSAEFLVLVHGVSAMPVALKRIDDCTLFGDTEGECLWSKIIFELANGWGRKAGADHCYTVH